MVWMPQYALSGTIASPRRSCWLRLLTATRSTVLAVATSITSGGAYDDSLARAASGFSVAHYSIVHHSIDHRNTSLCLLSDQRGSSAARPRPLRFAAKNDPDRRLDACKSLGEPLYRPRQPFAAAEYHHPTIINVDLGRGAFSSANQRYHLFIGRQTVESGSVERCKAFEIP